MAKNYWTNEQEDQLIDFFENQPSLYDKRDPKYIQREYRYELIDEISAKLALPCTYDWLDLIALVKYRSSP